LYRYSSASLTLFIIRTTLVIHLSVQEFKENIRIPTQIKRKNPNSAPKCFAVPVFKYIPVHGGRGGGLFAAGIKAPSPGYVSSEASPSPL
jgi:hypothetical protein